MIPRTEARSHETVRNWISRFTDNAFVTELIGTQVLYNFDAPSFGQRRHSRSSARRRSRTLTLSHTHQSNPAQLSVSMASIALRRGVSHQRSEGDGIDIVGNAVFTLNVTSDDVITKPSSPSTSISSSFEASGNNDKEFGFAT